MSRVGRGYAHAPASLGLNFFSELLTFLNTNFTSRWTVGSVYSINRTSYQWKFIDATTGWQRYPADTAWDDALERTYIELVAPSGPGRIMIVAPRGTSVHTGDFGGPGEDSIATSWLDTKLSSSKLGFMYSPVNGFPPFVPYLERPATQKEDPPGVFNWVNADPYSPIERYPWNEEWWTNFGWPVMSGTYPPSPCAPMPGWTAANPFKYRLTMIEDTTRNDLTIYSVDRTTTTNRYVCMVYSDQLFDRLGEASPYNAAQGMYWLFPQYNHATTPQDPDSRIHAWTNGGGRFYDDTEVQDIQILTGLSDVNQPFPVGHPNAGLYLTGRMPVLPSSRGFMGVFDPYLIRQFGREVSTYKSVRGQITSPSSNWAHLFRDVLTPWDYTSLGNPT